MNSTSAWASIASSSFNMGPFQSVKSAPKKGVTSKFEIYTSRSGKKKAFITLQELRHTTSSQTHTSKHTGSTQPSSLQSHHQDSSSNHPDAWAALHHVEPTQWSGPEQYLREYIGRRPDILWAILEACGPKNTTSCTGCHTQLNNCF
jgi:hypothetical protein